MFAVDPGSPNIIYTGCDGGVYKSKDRGSDGSWSLFTNGLSKVEFYDIANGATNPLLAIGWTQDNGTIKYSGPNELWTEILGGDGGTVDIDPANEQIFYAMNQGASSMVRFADGGNSWSSELGNTNATNQNVGVEERVDEKNILYILFKTSPPNKILRGITYTPYRRILTTHQCLRLEISDALCF